MPQKILAKTGSFFQVLVRQSFFSRMHKCLLFFFARGPTGIDIGWDTCCYDKKTPRQIRYYTQFCAETETEGDFFSALCFELAYAMRERQR